MNTLSKSLISLFCIFLFATCASNKKSNITFIESSLALDKSIPKLDIYEPRKSEDNPVVIFVHGGYWDEGDKKSYSFLGRNLAKEGIVTVIPNYTLSPNGNYETMAKEVAAAIQWTVDSISKHKGDPTQVYLMGHSAGGHLIALVGSNTRYLKNTDLIKGIILNDAAALDIYSYLKENPPTKDHSYNVTWTEDEENWKDASPIYFLSDSTPRFLIFVGTKTFPTLITQNIDFVEKLKQFQPKAEIIYDKKKHVAMMTQFIYPWNDHYAEIIEFMSVKD